MCSVFFKRIVKYLYDINNTKLITNIISNKSVLLWFEQIFRNDKEKIEKIKNFQHKSENISNKLIVLEEKLLTLSGKKNLK